jgi:hypothetical protein
MLMERMSGREVVVMVRGGGAQNPTKRIPVHMLFDLFGIRSNCCVSCEWDMLLYTFEKSDKIYCSHL